VSGIQLVTVAHRKLDGKISLTIVRSDNQQSIWVGDVDLSCKADMQRVAAEAYKAIPGITTESIEHQMQVIDPSGLDLIDEDGRIWGVPEELQDPLPEVLPYRSDLLPEVVGNVVDDIAERMQCPPDFPAAAMLVAMAAVIGNRIGIRPRRFNDWLVVPNLWGCVVGRPSLKKSPAIAEAEKRIRAIEAREHEKVAKELGSFSVDKLIDELRVKAIKKEIDSLMKSGDEATARVRAQEIKEIEESVAPIARRIITTDSTIEKLGEMLNKYPHGMLLWVDELLFWLRGLDKQDMAGVRQQYLTLWNGYGRLNIDRVGRGETAVPHPCLSLFGCATPGGIGDYVADAMRGGRGDDGLIQRLQILVWPDSPSEYRLVDRWPNSEARDRLVEVFESLADLNVESFAERDKYDDGTGIPWVRFNSDGQIIFDQWDVAIQNRIRTGNLPEAFESHLSKYASLVPSIALVLHLAAGGRGPVSGEATVLAMRWAEYLESHAARLYSIAVAPERRQAKPLLAKLVNWPKDKPIRARDISRKGWSGLNDVEVVRKTMELLADMGWVQSTQSIPESGRPTTLYAIHPQAAEFLGALHKRSDKTDKTDKTLAEGDFVGFVGTLTEDSGKKSSGDRERIVLG